MEFRRISQYEKLEAIWAKIPAIVAASNSRTVMKDATFSRLQDGTFILQSLVKYSTGVRAIEVLRNLGSLPSSFEKSGLPTSVITFL
ncbi:hypothetical protein PM082_018596 [Marasmius tenuissimus]|nr:hypothetical protein PM082_018596 [Marasmius tenuissimus]